jgi:crossover junction endodeoxyribonuclease RuvC
MCNLRWICRLSGFFHPVKIVPLLQKAAKIILGIDPGTLQMGYGIIEVHSGRMILREMQTVRLSSKKDNHERLHLIHQKVVQLIIQYKPHEFAIEAPFFGKNVQSMLKLGRAQGVAIAAAIHAGIPVTEYSPRKVKQSITGNGNADKVQVWKMLRSLLDLQQEPDYYDATDALAIAVCHHFQMNPLVDKSAKKFKGWEDFLKNRKVTVSSRK